MQVTITLNIPDGDALDMRDALRNSVNIATTAVMRHGIDGESTYGFIVEDGSAVGSWTVTR